MGKITVFLKRLSGGLNWIHKEEFTKQQFLSLFIHITFSIAVSQLLKRHCQVSHKSPWIFKKMACWGCFMVALVLSPSLNPSSSTPNIQTSHHTQASGISTTWSRHQLPSLSLPSLLTSSISSKYWTGVALWLGGRFLQFLRTPTQALAIALWSSLWVRQCCLS